MPFEYYQIEDEVVEKLRTALSSLQVDVVVIPDDEEDYARGIEKPRITVAFAGVDVIRQQGSNQRSYQELITFICNIQSGSLRSDIGCHSLARKIKDAVVGFQTTHCGRIDFKSYSGSNPIRNTDNKLWYWDVEFTCTKVYAQVLDDENDPDAPLLKQVTINDQVQIL
jgi:hypothetical protein